MDEEKIEWIVIKLPKKTVGNKLVALLPPDLEPYEFIDSLLEEYRQKLIGGVEKEAVEEVVKKSKQTGSVLDTMIENEPETVSDIAERKVKKEEESKEDDEFNKELLDILEEYKSEIKTEIINYLSQNFDLKPKKKGFFK